MNLEALRIKLDRGLVPVLILNAFICNCLCVITLRALWLGSEFSWQVGPLYGAGIHGHFSALLLFCLWSFGIQVYGLRKPQKPYNFALLGYVTCLFIFSFFTFFQGSTVFGLFSDNSQIPLKWFVMPCSVLLAMAVYWSFESHEKRLLHQRRKLKWSPLNNFFLITGVLMFPLSAYLFEASQADSSLRTVAYSMTHVHWALLSCMSLPFFEVFKLKIIR